MKLKTLLLAIQHDTETSSAEEILRACKLITTVEEMGAAERDTLRAAFKHGPLYDGDVPSKSGRDSLLEGGFIAKVVVKGEDGFNACTYRGRNAYRIIEALEP